MQAPPEQEREAPYSVRLMRERFPGKRLIVASNREPYSHRKDGERIVCEMTVGGLVAALDPVMQAVGGGWVAWGSGGADRLVVDGQDRIGVPPERPAYTLRRVWLTEEEVRGFYAGYSNNFIWPLCHLAMNRMILRRSDWEAYQTVNRRFAEAILEEAAESAALVWMQDYHLALCPQLVKARRPDLSLSIFWHIPWPAHDVYRVCPQRKELLLGLLGCDVVGFHVGHYCDNFLDCAAKELGAEVDRERGLIRHGGREVSVRPFPISVDYAQLDALASLPSAPGRVADLKRRLNLDPAHRYGIGVDRLDYTKGLLKRLQALDCFFETYPEYHSRFTFIQFGVPTRTDSAPYTKYREDIQALVADINRRHGKGGWEPIRYLEVHLGQEELAAYYRGADLCIISSIYDGMNLVAKEFIACQTDEQGVLLLSELAGAAQELGDALFINPYDSEGFARVIQAALELPLTERQRRMRGMRAYLKGHDIYYWKESVLRAMIDAGSAL